MFRKFRIVIIFDYITMLHLCAQKIIDFLLDVPQYYDFLFILFFLLEFFEGDFAN